ncbi:uncharacterized protein LOC114310647 [Camellia sinensis]|uniref:uncharacterized protein LOC114310647 n=1 Tax=Camellia sinensis TaxID=4442 RepID=UPI0010369035|nr:uncharacterized protein LOC114310647 [Camellia sinensis]
MDVDGDCTLLPCKETVLRELMVDVSRPQLYGAKKKAREVIEGDQRVQYAKVTGFVKGNKLIIGLNGCHLKGICGGQLLCALGRDGNNNYFPISWAVVKAESKDSWVWFLRQLMDDIGNADDMGWVLISDKQKGLVLAFEEIMPNVEHRFCMRHIYLNFIVKFKGIELRDLLWKAAAASTMREFEFHMNKLKEMDSEEKAYKWLRKMDPALWTRSHFSSRSRCDTLVNNMCESFNNNILKARDKPIINMLEWIRRKVMHRIQIKKKGMEKYTCEICPNVVKDLEVLKVQARNCFATYCGDRKFEVNCGDTIHIVDLEERKCSCRMWDLTGMPCKHAISSTYIQREKPEDYVHPYYSKHHYLVAYNSMIHPVPCQHDWIKTGLPVAASPLYRKQPGRPPKMRKNDIDEPKNPVRVLRQNRFIPTRVGHTFEEFPSMRGNTSASHPTRVQYSSPKFDNSSSQPRITEVGQNSPHLPTWLGNTSLSQVYLFK